jgi:hypothetical protein
VDNSSPWPSLPRGKGLSTQQKEEIMKRVITPVVFVISFVSLLVLGLVSRVQAGDCSNNSLKGTYGASCEGTIVGAGPVAVVGVLTADGDGSISGVETLSVNGEITTGVTFTGTYTVNADCTGSIVTTTPDGSVTDHDFVIDDNKKEIRIIVAETGRVIVCVGRKQ